MHAPQLAGLNITLNIYIYSKYSSVEYLLLGGQGAHAQLAAAEAQLERALEDSLVDGDDDFYDDSDEDTPAADGDEDSPPSFSRVDLCQSDSQIAQQFPSFPVGALSHHHSSVKRLCFMHTLKARAFVIDRGIRRHSADTGHP